MHTRLLCTALATLSAAPLAQAALTWDANGSNDGEDNGQTDGSGSWLGTDRWWTGVSNTTWSPGSPAAAEFGNGPGGGSVSLASPIDVSSLTFRSGSYSLSGSAITLDGVITAIGGSGTISMGLTLNATNPSFSNSGAGLLTIGACTGTAATGATQIIDVGSSGSGGITLNGNISDGGDGGKVALKINNTDTNTAATTLSGASTFTGGVTLQSGMLNINSAGVLNSSGPLGNGGTFTINGGALSGAGVVANINPIIVTNDFSFGNGTNTSLTLPGDVDLGDSTHTITCNGTGSLGFPTFTLSGLVSNGGIIKDGTRTLSLTNPANDYAGGTVINGGILRVTSDGCLGDADGDVTFNGIAQLTNPGGYVLTCNPNRTFTLNAEAEAILHPHGADALTIQGKVTGSGNLIIAGASLVVPISLTNAGNDFTGSLSISRLLEVASLSDVTGVGMIKLGGVADMGGGGNFSEGIFRWIGASGTTKSFSNRQFALNGNTSGVGTAGGQILADGATAADNLVIERDLLITSIGNRSLTLGGNNLGANTFAGDIADGPGSVISLIKTGASQWTLSGDNSFSGGLTLSGGVGSLLNFKSPTAVGTGTFTISGGKIDNTSGSPLTLTTNNTQSWSNNFTFVGSDDLHMGSGAVSMGATRTVTVTANTLTIGGSISGSGFGLTKAGNGTLALDGSSSYTGTTTVSGGTLKLGVDHALSDSSNVVIGNGILHLPTTVNDTVGTLDVTNAASQIQLGLGATLAFADSSTVSWTGGALNITGAFVPGSSIRFGATSSALTSVQLALIRVNGSGAGTYTLTADGYLIGDLTAYETWSDGAAFNADSNGDGVDNGLAWMLGAENKDANANALLPAPLESAGKLVITFDCLSTNARGSALLTVQYSNDMGLSDPWSSHTAAVPGEVGISNVNGVNFTATANGALIHVVAEIPLFGTSDNRLFGRLYAEP